MGKKGNTSTFSQSQFVFRAVRPYHIELLSKAYPVHGTTPESKTDAHSDRSFARLKFVGLKMTQTTLDLEIQAVLRPMMIPDLRQELRARGMSPAGSISTLRERLGAEMTRLGSASLQPAIVAEANAACNDGPGKEAASGDMGVLKNNYVRPEGQNVGNFITDRPSSRVLAPPGGGSNISLG